MRRKWRLVVSIIIFILVGILVGLGLWGVLGGNIGIGGDIYFSAEDLEVTIAGKLYGHRYDCMTEDTAEELPGATWTANTIAQGGSHTLDWTNLTLNFADKNTPIIIEVKITNNHTEQTVAVGISDKTVTEDKNFTVDISGSGTAIENVIAPGETATYLVVLRIVDITAKVNGELDVIFSLTSIY